MAQGMENACAVGVVKMSPDDVSPSGRFHLHFGNAHHTPLARRLLFLFPSARYVQTLRELPWKSCTSSMTASTRAPRSPKSWALKSDLTESFGWVIGMGGGGWGLLLPNRQLVVLLRGHFKRRAAASSHRCPCAGNFGRRQAEGGSISRGVYFEGASGSTCASCPF